MKFPKLQKMKKVTAYKAFRSDWTCRLYQYKAGETFHHKGPVKLCEKGFHGCLSPLDCLYHYSMIDSKFAEVEMYNTVKEKFYFSETLVSKRVTDTLHIVRELTLREFIDIGINVMLADKTNLIHQNSNAKIGPVASGRKLVATGNMNEIVTYGANRQVVSTGYSTAITAFGIRGIIISTGNASVLTVEGMLNNIYSSGDAVRIAVRGNHAKIVAQGQGATITGDGYRAVIDVQGPSGVVAITGLRTRVRGVKGTLVCLCDYDDNMKRTGFVQGIIGQDGIPENVFLKAENGRLVEDENLPFTR